MKYSDLGKTGLSLSVVAFGCGPTGGGVLAGTPLEQELLVGHAIDAGINIFDTAAIYGQGKSEENLGRALNQLIYKIRTIRTNKKCRCQHSFL